MKNGRLKIILFFIFLIIFFGYALKTRALIFAPYLDVMIVTKTIGGENSFDYSFASYSAGEVSANYQENFSTQTVAGEGWHSISTGAGEDDQVFIEQTPNPDWHLTIDCTSDNEAISFAYSADKVSITVYPFSSITCTFTNTKVQKKTPVVIIPGALSSYLNLDDADRTEIWPNILKALFGLPGDHYLDELSLNENGQPDPAYPTVLPTDIIRKIRDKDFFDGLIKRLEAEGYEEGKDLFVFPYDWRLDVGAVPLKDRLAEILEQTGSPKVDIIAHSLGGLVSKYYIKHGGQGKVGKFIDIGTPHLGAPTIFKTLMYGDDLGIKFGWFGLNAGEIKKISQNMTSAYQLLPSENYFSATSPDYKYYVYDMDDVDKDGTRGRLTFDQTTEFLKNSGRNELLLDQGADLHADLDLMNPADYGVTTYNIVGCGEPTIGKFFTLGRKHNKQYYDVAYISGDGSVPERSARSFPALEEYQITDTSHSLLPSAPGVKELIASLLTDKISTFNFAAYSNISLATPACALPDGDILSFHGPVQIDIYDQDQNHAGPVPGSSNFEQNIPGVFYDIIDRNIFIFLSYFLDPNYKIKITAQEKGSFSSHVKRFRGGNVTSTSYFNDVPLANDDTSGELIVDHSENQDDSLPQIILAEEIILPSSEVPGDSLDDNTPPTTNVSVVPTSTSTAVNFESADDDILETEYSVDGGETFTTAPSATTSPIIITQPGTTTIFYHSTDTAGNIEEIQEMEIHNNPTLILIDPETTPEPEVTSTQSRENEPEVANHRSRSPKKTKDQSQVVYSTETSDHIENFPSLASVTEVSVSEIDPKAPAEEIISDALSATSTDYQYNNDPYYATVLSSGITPRQGRLFWWLLILIILLLLLLWLGRDHLKKVK